MSSLLNRAKSLKSSSTAAPKGKHYDSSKGRHSDDLLARYNQYNNINKSLIDWFTASRDSEKHRAIELTKQATHIPVPFAEGDQFIQEEHGFQSMLYKLRDHTRSMAEIHNGFAHTIDNEVLSLLNENKSNLKHHLDSLNSELGKEADIVDKEREASTNSLGEYGKSISMISSGHGIGAANAKHDPFVQHGTVERQLLKQLEHENRLTRSTIQWQQSSETFEQSLVTKIHKASERFTEAQTKHNQRLQEQYSEVGSQLTSVDSKKEWEHFSHPDAGRIIDPQTQLRDPGLLSFPDQNHEYSKPLKEGLLERKKRHTKKYAEYYMVLTPAGFLLEYPSEGIVGEDPKAFNPALSLYLPDFTLSAPSPATDKKHKFYVTGARTAASGKDSSHGLRKKKEVAYTFKGRSHGEMMSWWEACDGLVRRSLSATTSSPTRNTPTNQTVAGVGYAQSNRTSIADSATPSRQYATSTNSQSPAVQREQYEVTQGEDEEEESDDASIGGSSVEEEHAASAHAAPALATGGETHANHIPVHATHVESTHSSTEQHAPVQVHQTQQAELAPALGLPAYHGATEGSSHGYPIDKKVGFANEPIDHNSADSSIPHQDAAIQVPSSEQHSVAHSSEQVSTEQQPSSGSAL